MPLLVNLRHLEAHPLRLEGELATEELDIEPHDEAMALAGPLRYDFTVQRLEESLLLQGSLRLTLECQCVRCLKPFQHDLSIDPWTIHLPLQGEEAVSVNNDLIDLTPYIQEDILLEFPQHPLCDAECRGLPQLSVGKAKSTNNPGPGDGSPAWNELNKLKL